MTASSFAAVVLAGGLSSRMKQFKPMLPLGETTIADYVVSTFRGVGVDDGNGVIPSGKGNHPMYNDKRGHPPLIPSSLARDILDFNKEGGLKACLETNNASSLDLPVHDEFILRDIDTPDDYNQLLTEYRAST